MPAEIAWRWLTEPALATKWLAERVDGDFAMGGRVEFSSRDMDGGSLQESGEIVAFRPARRCVLHFRRSHRKWDSLTKVTLEIFPRGSSCEISVFHEGFEYLSLSECLTFWEFYRRRWRSALTRLAAATSAVNG